MLVIDVDFSKQSIRKAITQLRNYNKGLEVKSRRLVNELSKIGIDAINSIVAQIDPSNLHSGELALKAEKSQVKQDGDVARMAISLTGADVLFVEFSAGITYGTSEYPLASGAGYGMGTYNPDSGRWKDPEGWWYTDENGKSRHTYGNRAYMPMYHSTEAMALSIWVTAKKIFGG